MCIWHIQALVNIFGTLVVSAMASEPCAYCGWVLRARYCKATTGECVFLKTNPHIILNILVLQSIREM